MTKYGIKDQDGLWMGDEDGPVLYDSEYLARAGATVLRHRFDCERDFSVEPYPQHGWSRKVDNVAPPTDFDTALRRAEGAS